jgi:lipid A 4'-phosphatase
MLMKNDTKNILLHLAILVMATVPFWLFDVDVKFQSMFFDFSSQNWRYAGTLPVKILYDFGVYPAIIMTAIAAIVFGLGFAYKKLEKHRKLSLLIMLALFIGPAVTINVVLKNYTGRPRPREIKEFNGRMDFKNVLELGTPGRGYSFPCGHASMGFLFTALFFAFRRKNRAVSYAALFGGLFYGSALGAVRMAHGIKYLAAMKKAYLIQLTPGKAEKPFPRQ